MKKCRLFYCCFHDTLRKVDLPVLLGAGFEVIPYIPPKAMIDEFKFDSTLVEENQDWKNYLTIPLELAEKIRRIDIYNMSGTGSVNPFHLEVGYPGEQNAGIINENIDVILLSSFPNALTRCLSWFKGITVFRLFGNERESFRILDWYYDCFDIQHIKELYQKRYRYVSCPIMLGTTLIEDDLIMGPHRQQVCTYMDIQGVHGVQWNPKYRKKSIVTNISYIHENPNWTEHYRIFAQHFDGIPFKIIGKNNIEICTDSRINPIIKDRKQYLTEMTSHSLFISVGQSRQHSQYSPFESILMGLPTLFLENSGLAVEFLERSGKDQEELRRLGMCSNWSEMAMRAKCLLEDEKSLLHLSKEQPNLLNGTFSYSIATKQASKLKAKCQELLGQSDHDGIQVDSEGPRNLPDFNAELPDWVWRKISHLIPNGKDLMSKMAPKEIQFLASWFDVFHGIAKNRTHQSASDLLYLLVSENKEAQLSLGGILHETKSLLIYSPFLDQILKIPVRAAKKIFRILKSFFALK